jgi:GNAT superfamily N-acetyltransferase
VDQPFVIRPRVAADVETLAPVLQAVHVNDQWPKCAPDDWARWMVVANENAAWVAEVDGRAVGHISLQSPPMNELMLPFWEEALGVALDQMIEITRFFLSPDHRGIGAGKALFAQAQQEARARGLSPVLYTGAIDVAAQQTYERSGWRRAGEAPETLPDGSTLVMIAYV